LGFGVRVRVRPETLLYKLYWVSVGFGAIGLRLGLYSEYVLHTAITVYRLLG